MRDETAPKSWKARTFTVIASALGVLVLAGFAIRMFLVLAWAPVHPNPNAVPSVSSTAPPQKWAAAVEEGRKIARAALVAQNLPGVSVAVGADGGIVWAEGLGWADLEKRVPVAPPMRFRIGHASNALTSAAVGLLVEKGRLNLDAEIQEYVPEYPRKQWPVTVRQLMGNVGGVRHYRNAADYTPAAHCGRAAEGIPTFANDPLLFEPETEYGYSTFGWVLVSAAVEAVAKEPFFTFMRSQVFTPLGLNGTVPDSTDPIPDRVTFYTPRLMERWQGYKPAAGFDYSCFAGAGGFLSTPSDLVRFGLALGSGKLLQPATVKKLQTPQLLASGKETEYGLGWMLETVTLGGQPTAMVGHASRTLVGGTTSFMTFPERGLLVAVTTNTENAITRNIALAIAEVFAEQPQTGKR